MQATQTTYTRVCFPQDGGAYRRFGQYHAANLLPVSLRKIGCYQTLCGKQMTGQDLHCFADEPHTITCRACRKKLVGELDSPNPGRAEQCQK